MSATRYSIYAIVIVAACVVNAKQGLTGTTEAERLAAIRRARVWEPSDVASKEDRKSVV